MANELDDMLSSFEMEDWLSYESIEYRNTRGSSGPQLNVKICPSCGKEDWKVYIGEESGLGNCNHGSCQMKFNKFTFIREYLLNYNEKVNMREYLKAFAREMGWRPKRIASVAVELTSDDLKLPKYDPLPIDGKNLKYLSNRRVDVETAQYFNLGYIREGYFGKRIFIPIHDLDGELVSFQARDITGKADRKYLFPAGFGSTGKILYNGQNALGKKSAVLVEGAFDVIGTRVAFITDRELRKVAILGSFGMHLSGSTDSGDNDQLGRFIKLKQAGLETVTIAWDGEAKALLKAVIAGRVLKRIGLNVRLAILPKDRDPSDLDPETLRQCYWGAKLLTPEYAQRIKMRGGKMSL